ncbi:sigma 54-interacting transcriptional regulator [Bacillus sp. FJAT-49736]|uniref:sigma-54 interaction domain-containing protein n=1 Tax=Bacillus sp. FJAT-49736 TaxID=2833582 RepID=UPI001BCA26BC|nr:sigma 54-interacting transcriptional regulator [Bacillus sp. FJAT-49736]MBS4172005.1 sigma 54-interacting transcriptional regulator [Bacillus sp. FJAT-49736]
MNLGIGRLPFKWLDEIINLAAERIVVVDRDGIIRYINSAYCEFLGTTVEDATDKPVQDIIENSRMHIVARTGQAELAAVQPINDSEMIANRYPLYIEEELVGAVGTVMFKNPQEWWEYSKKIQPILEELNYYKNNFEKGLASKYTFEDLIGSSTEFIKSKMLAEKISVNHSAVLLLGESGTGKELFAHAIHHNSPRQHFPLVRINCASIPEHLLESELFGYEDGAFTGAKRGGKKGKFELANYGTIFLDEIGDMPLPMQSKLLRVLQEKEIERVGGQKPIFIDVRIIAATHRNLEKMVEEGTFRQDLYYRLNVIKIEIPPLRNRKEDIPAIAFNLLKKLERKFHRNGIVLSEEVLLKLMNHKWPGNIRELENVLERAINVLDGTNTVKMKHLPLYLQDDDIYISGYPSFSLDSMPPNNREESVAPLKDILSFVEKNAIIQALKKTNGNRLEAAKLLGISKTSLYDKCKSYQI